MLAGKRDWHSQQRHRPAWRRWQAQRTAAESSIGGEFTSRVVLTRRVMANLSVVQCYRSPFGSHWPPWWRRQARCRPRVNKIDGVESWCWGLKLSGSVNYGY